MPKNDAPGLTPEVPKPSHAPASLTDASEQGGDTFQDEAPYDVPGAVSDSARDGHREPARQDDFAEPQKSSASQWSAFEYLEGIEDLEDMPNFIIAKALEGAKPAGCANSFEWCKHLAQNPAEILEALTKANLLQKLVQGLTKQMKTLLCQAAATSAELNNKFLADGDALLEFGNRNLFDKGLVDWIGPPDNQDPLAEMYREHNKYDYSSTEITAWNYGIQTDALREWAAAAGEWTPKNKKYKLKAGFKIPGETKNIEPEQRRRMICLDDFLRPPTEEEKKRWLDETKEDFDSLPQEEQARCCVFKAELLPAEVLALRMWSGPMYYVYNGVLRGGVKGKFTTTLHALSSAITKLARIGTPETVYRGISGRAVTAKDFDKGAFVEKGAQSFTRAKQVAKDYASYGTGARYLLQVSEGEADQGADISCFSYYPHEKEKLYGPLVMMQVVGEGIEGQVLKLKMRVNINLRAGTLDEAMTQKHASLVAMAEMLYNEASVTDNVKELNRRLWLQWQVTGTTQPAEGEELSNPTLVAALESKMDGKKQLVGEQSFVAIGADKGGEISLDQLRAALKKRNPKVTEAEVTRAFADADSNKDGTVSKREFLKSIADQFAAPLQVEFTQEEWDEFGTNTDDVRADRYVKAGDSFFTPVGLSRLSLLTEVIEQLKAMPAEDVNDPDLFQQKYDEVMAAWKAVGTHAKLYLESEAILGAASGLMWRKAGDTKPAHGRNLENSELAEALTRQVEFTPQEWGEFGIKDLCIDDFVKSGESYFQPAAPVTAGEIQSKEADLKRRRAEVALPHLERRLWDLRFMWTWGLREVWISFAALVEVLICLILLGVSGLGLLSCKLVEMLFRFTPVHITPLANLGRRIISPVQALSGAGMQLSNKSFLTIFHLIMSNVGNSFTLQERDWALGSRRDIEIAGLATAVKATKSALRSAEESDGTRTLWRAHRWRRLLGLACCLAVVLACLIFFVVFAFVQPWGPTEAGVYCAGTSSVNMLVSVQKGVTRFLLGWYAVFCVTTNCVAGMFLLQPWGPRELAGLNAAMLLVVGLEFGFLSAPLDRTTLLLQVGSHALALAACIYGGRLLPGTVAPRCGPDEGLKRTFPVLGVEYVPMRLKVVLFVWLAYYGGFLCLRTLWLCLYMLASSPACGGTMWVLGWIALGASLLACLLGFGLAFNHVGESAAMPDVPADVQDLEDLEDELRSLYHRGGLLAKAPGDRNRIKKAVREALGRLSTRDLANKHVCDFFLFAVRHIVEECRMLPMRTADVQVRYATPRLLVEAAYESTNQSMEDDKAGLAWISAVELLQAGYERDDLELVLRLFETGTRPGALVLRSSELETERAAWHMAAVNVTHRYFDFCNLHAVAQGTLQKLHCAAVSNIQSSFLAAFVSIHGAGPVEVCLPAPVLPVVLGFHRDGSCSVGDTALDDSLLGLPYTSTGQLFLHDGRVSVDALGLLAHAAKWRFMSGASRAALLHWLQQKIHDSAGAIGLKWTAVGAQKPTKGQEIQNEALAAKLLNQLAFTQAEWDSFKIDTLPCDSFVQSGDLFFKPAAGDVVEALEQVLQGIVSGDAPDGARQAVGKAGERGARRALPTLSDDAQLVSWGVRADEVRSEVRGLMEQRCRVSRDLKRIWLDGNTGLGGADGGKEAMRRLGELLLVIAPSVQRLGIEKCGLGDAGAQEVANLIKGSQAVQRLPRLRFLFLFQNPIGPRGQQSLQRAWQGRPAPNAIREQGLVVTFSDQLRFLLFNPWELMPVFRTRKEVQAARAWPAATDQRLVELAGGGRTEAVVALVQKCGANPNAQVNGCPALHAAAGNGHAATVRALAETTSPSANVHAVDGWGRTALALARENGHENVVTVLQELTDRPLHRACLCGDAESVSRLLSGRATDVDARDVDGRTSLMVASAQGHRGIVETLLGAGARPECADNAKMTALMLACSEGKGEVATVLVEPTRQAGALDLQDERGYTALMWSAEQGLVPAVQRLTHSSANCALTNQKGMTPLALACAKRHEEAAKILIAPTRQAGAIDLADGRGFTAMEWSKMMALQSVGDVLQEQGAAAGLPPVLVHSGSTENAENAERDEDTISLSLLRKAGLSAEECRDAGYNVSELTNLCHVPWGESYHVPDWGPYVGRAVIAEGKFGRIAQLHLQKCDVIKVKYDDGSWSGTCNDGGAKSYLDTGGAGRGAVRLLEWASTQ